MSSSGRDSYRPDYRNGPPPSMPPDAANAMYNFGRDRDQKRHDFSFRSRPGPRTASQRKLLTTRPTSERPVLGSNHGEDRFRNIEDLTDSDEADMEGSSEDDEDRPQAKRIRLTQDATSTAPKWSNPDPYTSLPPPMESNGKRTDVVKLIRKARNDAANQSGGLSATQDDFISFGDDGDDTSDGIPANAPTGPKAARSADASVQQHATQSLGKRKRDENDGRLLGRFGRQFHADGMILEAWRSQNEIDATPWLESTDFQDPAVIALHKEIIDFYQWVRPKDFEFDVRGAVMQRISRTLNRLEPGELKAFGSYAAGLYLPTGDMDLVYISKKKYGPGSLNIPPSKKTLYSFRGFIERQGLARPGSTLVIPSAKVPIIKFVEAESGLKIDLSFNNDSGVVAVETFSKWKKIYQAMPIIVSVIKQFLMIRGLNDVSVGGLGGFSTICLVTSIVQHLPPGKTLNLGEVLLEFFNVYGNLFDRRNVGIRLEPPSYIDKRQNKLLIHSNEQADRLTIIDPNRPDNNISGGSHEIARIFKCFRSAYQILQQRFDEYKNSENRGTKFSFLADLVGGDFSAYEVQRKILHDLHYGNQRHTAPAVVPPPPPPIRRAPAPPPPPPLGNANAVLPNEEAGKNGSSRGVPSSTTSNADGTAMTKSELRLARIKRCRPDLVKALGNKTTISVTDACKIGGWKDGASMDKALQKAEKKLATQS